MGIRSRLRSAVRWIQPMHVAALGLLSIPGHLFEPVAWLEIFGLFFLALLWPLVEPLFGMLTDGLGDRLPWIGTDEEDADDAAREPTDWIDMGGGRELARGYLMLPLTLLNPVVLTQDLLQTIGALTAYVRHRGTLPSAEGYEQRRSYRLPVEGEWTVVNGGPDRETSHSWFPVNQRYAYDFVITDDEGRTRPEGADTDVEEYYCYDEPVLAPAAGVVVDAFDDGFEAAHGGGLSHLLKRDIRGNYVVIQHAPDEYSCLAHLVPGSVEVKPGDRVAQGEAVGRCGHSGNSSEPHLHFQLQDHPSFTLAAGLPIAFDDANAALPEGYRPSPVRPKDDETTSGEDVGQHSVYESIRPAVISRGQRVVHDGTNGVDSNEVDADEVDANRISVNGDRTRPGDAEKIHVSPGTGRGIGSTLLRHGSYGVCLGGVLALFGGLLLATPTVASGLVMLTGTGVLWSCYALASGHRSTSIAGSIGTTIGLAGGTAVFGAAVWTDLVDSIGASALPPLLLAVGFLCYYAVAEYERFQYRTLFGDRGGPSPS